MEAEAVVQWTRGLARENFRVMRYDMLNAPNNPAFLVMIERVK